MLRRKSLLKIGVGKSALLQNKLLEIALAFCKCADERWKKSGWKKE